MSVVLAVLVVVAAEAEELLVLQEKQILAVAVVAGLVLAPRIQEALVVLG
jgi:hypothetical protein